MWRTYGKKFFKSGKKFVLCLELVWFQRINLKSIFATKNLTKCCSARCRRKLLVTLLAPTGNT